MHYGHSIDSDRQLIFQVFAGHFTVADIIECTRCLWDDPSYSTTHNGIVDITQMSPGAVIADLHSLTAFLKDHPKTSRSRWAVITDSPLVTAGSLFYKTLMSGRHSLEVFSTWEAACTYLQLDSFRPSEPVIKITRPDAPAPAVT
jgi:hypothetical protein